MNSEPGKEHLTENQAVPHQDDGVRTILIRPRAILLVLLLVAALVVALKGTELWSRYRALYGASPQSRSDMVTASAADSLVLGSPRREIAWLLGTNGEKREDGLTVYASEQLTGSGIPAYQIGVYFDENDCAVQIIWKNLEASSQIGAVRSIVLPASIPPNASIEQIADLFGVSVSMMVAGYNEQGEEEIEYHFGYCDPLANFSPSWRGEYLCTVSPQNGSFRLKWCWSYSGTAPIAVDGLEDSPLTSQYNDYDTYLDDWFGFEAALQLLNGYSRGDLITVFEAQLTEYSAHAGMHFYELIQARPISLLESGEPSYRIMAVLSAEGYFRAGAYTNLRLYNRSGMLDGIEWAYITRGMSYREVQQRLGILPTAFFCDESYITLCYGSFTGAEVYEEQFELMIRFDRDSNLAQNVYTNLMTNFTDEPETSGGEG